MRTVGTAIKTNGSHDQRSAPMLTNRACAPSERICCFFSSCPSTPTGIHRILCVADVVIGTPRMRTCPGCPRSNVDETMAELQRMLSYVACVLNFRLVITGFLLVRQHPYVASSASCVCGCCVHCRAIATQLIGEGGRCKSSTYSNIHPNDNNNNNNNNDNGIPLSQLQLHVRLLSPSL